MSTRQDSLVRQLLSALGKPWVEGKSLQIVDGRPQWADAAGGGGPAAKVACRTDVVTHNSEVIVPFNQVLYDPAGMVAGNTFVAPSEGLYSAKLGPVPFTPYGSQGWPNHLGNLATYLVLNGDEYVGQNVFFVGGTDFSNSAFVARPLRLTVVADVHMQAGDVLDARLFTNFGVDVHSNAAGGASQDSGPGYFASIARVG